MKINEKGYWENKTAEGHGVDEKLANAIVDFFRREKISSVIDLGCGDGYYVERLNLSGIFSVGYDGNPYTREFSRSDMVYVHDLTEPLPLSVRLKPFDWCLTLEVGEHIPKEYEKKFLDNVDASCKDGVILSWAIPGQNGDGHVNCHTNEYVEQRMHMKGFIFDLMSTSLLRQNASPFPETGYWFKNTLMVFRRL